VSVLTTFVLYGVAFAAAFAAFVLGRYLAGSIFHVVDRVPPFGEARPSGFVTARPGARLAITLAGPAAIYVFAASLCTLGLVLGASVASGQGTTIVGFARPSPAEASGLKEGDRITAVAGTPVRLPPEIRPALERAAGTVEVLAEREGQEMRFLVSLGPDQKLRVQLGPNREEVGVGRAILIGMSYPFQIATGSLAAMFTPAVRIDVVGPIGLVTMTARRQAFADRLVMVGSVESIVVILFLLGSLSLWSPPIVPPAAPAVADTPNWQTNEATVVARPGLRFVARAVDWTLVWVASSLVSSSARVLFVLPVFGLVVEALLLSAWGFTPGKWLLRIAVRDGEGHRPTLRAALYRAGAVWAYGVGAETPFGLATAVLAYSTLKRAGATYWDQLGGYRVHHRRAGVVRAAIAGLILVLGVALLAASVVGS